MPVIRVDAWASTYRRPTHLAAVAALSLARSALRHLALQAESAGDRERAVEALEKIALVLGERAQGGGRN